MYINTTIKVNAIIETATKAERVKVNKCTKACSIISLTSFMEATTSAYSHFLKRPYNKKANLSMQNDKNKM